MKPKESVQQYGDRFANLMRRTVRGDSDETLIPVFIKGLDNGLQEMMNISRVTEITASLDGSTRAAPSIKREIKRAMTLDAGRSRKDNNPRSDQNDKIRSKKEQDSEPPKKSTVPKGNSNPIDVKTTPSPPGTDTKKKNNRKCFKCKEPGWEPGHVCKTNKDKENNNLEVAPVDDRSFSDKIIDDIFSYQMSAMSSSEEMQKLLHTPILINGVSGMALVDSGADCSYISQEFVQKNNLQISPARGMIKSGNGEKMADRIGAVSVSVRNGTTEAECSLEVTKLPEGRAMIIGLPNFSTFGYTVEGVPTKVPSVEIEEPDEVVHPENILNVSQDPADLSEDVKVEISVNQNITLPTRCTHPLAVLCIEPTISTPIWKNVNYISPEDYQVVTDRVQKMLDDGVVEKAPDDCLNAFALVIVPKKDALGRKVEKRLCIDLRPLNPRINDIDYPLPKIQDVIDTIGSIKGEETVYSTIDIKDGYHRFRLREEERNWIAFRWNRVHYRFTCAPFGIKTMTSLFQRVMDKIFGDLTYVAVYVDDITIFSENPVTHVYHLVEVIRRLNNWKLPIRMDKSRFLQKRVRILGFIVSGEGVEKDPEKVKCFLTWPRPQTGKQMMRFLGAANFYRHFISNFSSISRPLDKVRLEKVRLNWNEEMVHSFETLRLKIAEYAIMVHPVMDKKFIVGTDGCKTGIGAWVGQDHDGTLKIVSYASRALSKSELHYSPTKLELLAIVFAIDKFHSYLVREIGRAHV